MSFQSSNLLGPGPTFQYCSFETSAGIKCRARETGGTAASRCSERWLPHGTHTSNPYTRVRSAHVDGLTVPLWVQRACAEGLTIQCHTLIMPIMVTSVASDSVKIHDGHPGKDDKSAKSHLMGVGSMSFANSAPLDPSGAVGIQIGMDGILDEPTATRT